MTTEVTKPDRLGGSPRLRQDGGTILLLTLGLIPILAGLVAVGTDAAVLFTHRRALAAEVDAAVLAAAQSADLRTLYTADRLESLPLDCRAARTLVQRRVGGEWADERAAGARVVGFECSASRVSLRVRSAVRLPFAAHFGLEPEVEVSSSSAARSPIR